MNEIKDINGLKPVGLQILRCYLKGDSLGYLAEEYGTNRELIKQSIQDTLQALLEHCNKAETDLLQS